MAYGLHTLMHPASTTIFQRSSQSAVLNNGCNEAESSSLRLALLEGCPSVEALLVYQTRFINIGIWRGDLGFGI